MSNAVGLSANIFKSAVARTNVRGCYRPAPSLFYFPGLTSTPWHKPEDFPFVKQLEENYSTILEEYLALEEESTDKNMYSRSLRPEAESDYKMKQSEHKLHDGKWDWFSYITKGEKQNRFKKLCPKTASILDNIEPLLYSTPFDFTFFSILRGKSKIASHYGPHNLRLRVHFPLIVPRKSKVNGKATSNDAPLSGIRVGGEVREWEEGKAIIFDDSFEHDAWNNSDDRRVVLLIDIWHPEIELKERAALQEMFFEAKKDGLFKK